MPEVHNADVRSPLRAVFAALCSTERFDFFRHTGAAAASAPAVNGEFSEALAGMFSCLAGIRMKSAAF